MENTGDISLKRRANKIISSLNLSPNERIIDIGCGDGFFLHLLSKLPIKLYLTGLDNDKKVLTNAKHNLLKRRLKLVLGDITNMPFPDRSFDKAIMTEVLEHMKDDKRALFEVHRILKPNGVLLLTVPSYNFPFLWDPINWILQNLFGFHISGTNFFAGIWARHLRLYERSKIERLIKNAGFKIEEVEELTTRCLPFNHYMVNIVARILYDIKPKSSITDSLNKFKIVKKPPVVKLVFFIVNVFDKLNDILPGKNGLNLYIKARR